MYDTFCPFLNNSVLISSLDSNVLGKLICSLSEEAPLCSFVVPPWRWVINRDDLVLYRDKDRPVVTSSKLLPYLSLDASMDVL